MKIEELREIFSEDGLYTVRVENGAIVSHCRINMFAVSTEEEWNCVNSVWWMGL